MRLRVCPAQALKGRPILAALTQKIRKTLETTILAKAPPHLATFPLSDRQKMWSRPACRAIILNNKGKHRYCFWIHQLLAILFFWSILIHLLHTVAHKSPKRPNSPFPCSQSAVEDRQRYAPDPPWPEKMWYVSFYPHTMCSTWRKDGNLSFFLKKSRKGTPCPRSVTLSCLTDNHSATGSPHGRLFWVNKHKYIYCFLFAKFFSILF